MKKLLIAILSLIFIGCSPAKLKTAFCDDTIAEFPKAYWGRYQGLSFDKNNEFNGALSYNITEIEIQKDGIVIPGSQGSNLLPIGMIPSLSTTNICEVGGSIFLQQLSQSGHYEVIRLEISQEGLHFAPMVFDPKDLVARKIPFFVPGSIKVKSTEEPAELYWTSEMMLMNNDVYVDNQGISRLEILRAAKFSPLRMSYNRVTTPEKRSGSKKSLTLKQYKIYRTL